MKQASGLTATVTPAQQPGIIPAVARIHAPAFWAHGIDGSGVIVAVIDTGGDAKHPYLAPAIIGGRCFVTGYQPENWSDLKGHGTHCLGLVRQVAPGVKLLVAKGLRDDGSGADDDLTAAVDWCVANKPANVPMILSMSWGGTGADDDNPAQRAALQRALAAGVLPLAAAGNDGHGVLDDVACPARWPEVVAVAATMQLLGGVRDGQDFPAFYSSQGPAVQLCAPGTDVLSCHPGDGGWVSLSGTSMATPITAGFYALVAQDFFRKFGRWPTPTELRMVAQLLTRDIQGAPREQVGCGEISAAPLVVQRTVTVTAGAAQLAWTQEDGKTGTIPLDAPAQIVPPGRMVAPARALGNAFGVAADEVHFDPATSTATFRQDVIPQGV